jgi:hypothetical protein
MVERLSISLDEAVAPCSFRLLPSAGRLIPIPWARRGPSGYRPSALAHARPARCRKLATTAATPEQKKMLEEMAAAWEKIAKEWRKVDSV